ncbi:hypothetical protein RclHR1_01300012 [Rhizophagus clarus]|uniref:Uncharacterized protein n=1 Tax=Rhizophagus clarus TaxID=94130 RepID=A0A2Z6Q903_9GLOM|nr:hypothetical protein RclHR1_01300012 [Rhizophagus clarus]GES95695.1 hypothetical protein GLOIN_2v1763712 [Rhizophagus clarus]
MDENLQRSYTYNSSTAMETGELHDFSTEIAAEQQTMQHQEPLITTHDISYNFAISNAATHITEQHQQVPLVLNYLKIYHFSPNDGNFYLVICKIILQNSLNDRVYYDHEFFYQHPSDPSINYHVTCELLPHLLIENFLNYGIYEMNFDTTTLSLNQKFMLELSLKQRLFQIFK